MKTISLLQFLKLLPHASRDGVRSLLGDGLSLFVKDGPGFEYRESVRIGAQTIRRVELINLAVDKRVDAASAGALLRLYKAGELPMNRGKQPTDCLLADAYLDQVSQAERNAAAALKAEQAQRRAEKEHHEAMVSDPDIIREEDFSLKLLNAIFFEHMGGGAAQMMIGNILVSKSQPIAYSSNSGRNRDWAYSYSWTSPADGQTKVIDRQSQFEANRRNDSGRNWGLPE